jgi:uncharacterized membrane protein
MTKKQLTNQLIIFLLFVILSVFVFLIVDRGIHFMLAWNALLAFFPIVIIFFFDRYKEIKYLNWLLFFIWLFFYPNSLYLITDLIYLNQDTFMQNQGNYQGLLYLQDFDAYLGFFHLFLGAMYGIVLSLVSFKYFYHFLEEKQKKLHMYFYIVLPLLVSVAIYIGRFLRLNSWDVLNPVNVITEFFRSINGFSFIYIGLFSLIQYIIFAYYIFEKKSYL